MASSYYFFYSAVSLHLQTNVVSGAQAGLSRCCFPWKLGEEKPLVHGVVVIRHPGF